jgi:flavin-dependent dehydrogenase
MARKNAQADVLVLGGHPCASLAALLLTSHKSPLRVTQISIPSEPVLDRLVLINPGFFSLHPALAPLKKKLKLAPISGVRFISDDTAESEHRAKSTMGFVGLYSELRQALDHLAQDGGGKSLRPSELEVEQVDHQGMTLSADGAAITGKMVLLAGALSDESARKLALPEPWGAEVVRRYSSMRLSAGERITSDDSIVPMSLDLGGALTWAWMLRGVNQVQLSVEQPIRGERSPKQLLELWSEVLKRHGLLKTEEPINESEIVSMEVPAAGALGRDTVANRTLLIGPAGGFFTACLEDIYPNCWSAVFATDTARKALKAEHLQDALAPYRENWGTTLGEYLRGPQQNLRFLLPLVYRNAVMTSRLAESILLGKSVVR